MKSTAIRCQDSGFRLAILALCLCASAVNPARAAIAPSGTAAQCNSWGTSSGAITRTSASGNTVVVMVVLPYGTTKSVSTITDTGGSSYAQRVINSWAYGYMEIWSTAAGGSLASTSVTVNLSNAENANACTFEYSGAVALGVTGTHTDNGGGQPSGSISITTQDSDNYCVVGTSDITSQAITMTAGTRRIDWYSGASPYYRMFLADNTVGSPGTCTVTATVSGNDTWTEAALELRSSGAVAAKAISGAGTAGGGGTING